MTTVEIEPTFDAWHAAARRLLGDGVSPGDVAWREARAPGGGERCATAATVARDEAPRPERARAEAPQPGVPAADAPSASVEEGTARGTGQFRVPRRFFALAREAATARDPARWSVLYEVVWRLVHEGADLIEDRDDRTVRRLVALATQARRDAERAETAEAQRVEAQGSGARPFVPADPNLDDVAEAARRCTGCELHRGAIQTVFGRGPADARIVLVGEQPGDQEDLRGAPFVGPAGEVLDRALAKAGLDRHTIYVTNAVKHFKFVERGKRRIHQTPRIGEILACRPWVEAELALVGPATLVCLGATAARSLLGDDFRLMRDRGRVFTTRWAPRTIATLHPSAVLRGEDDATQARLYRMLVDDLRLAAVVE